VKQHQPRFTITHHGVVAAVTIVHHHRQLVCLRVHLPPSGSLRQPARPPVRWRSAATWNPKTRGVAGVSFALMSVASPQHRIWFWNPSLPLPSLSPPPLSRLRVSPSSLDHSHSPPRHDCCQHQYPLQAPPVTFRRAARDSPGALVHEQSRAGGVFAGRERGLLVRHVQRHPVVEQRRAIPATQSERDFSRFQ
jgi:hypothetical protein